MAAISETRCVTRSERIACATSTPATSGRNTSSTRTRRTGRSSASATLREPNLGSRHGAEHRERHGQAMIARRVDPAAGASRRAAHEQVVATCLRFHTHGAQVRRDELEPVAFLYPQLAHLAEYRLAS